MAQQVIVTAWKVFVFQSQPVFWVVLVGNSIVQVTGNRPVFISPGAPSNWDQGYKSLPPLLFVAKLKDRKQSFEIDINASKACQLFFCNYRVPLNDIFELEGSRLVSGYFRHIQTRFTKRIFQDHAKKPHQMQITFRTLHSEFQKKNLSDYNFFWLFPLDSGHIWWDDSKKV